MSLNVELLEQSFDKIKPLAEEFGASFYEKLFTAHPELKPLFAKTDREKQQKKLISALVLVLENLRLSEADLSNANLTHANLNNANFSHAKLSWTCRRYFRRWQCRC